MARNKDTSSWAAEMGRLHDEATRQERRKERIRLELLQELYHRQHTLMDINFWPAMAREFIERVKQVI